MSPRLALPLLVLLAAPAPQDDTPPPREVGALVDLLAGQGIHLSPADRALGLPVTVEVRDDLLEYLLVLPHGAVHESLFTAAGDHPPAELETWAQSLNAALLTLGVVPGENARWVEKDPPPSEEELRAGVLPYDIVPPAGDAFHLYAAWREADGLHFHPIEDLVRDLDRGRTLRRQPFVYLGSRTIERKSGETSYAAALEGNLINVSFFYQGNTLLTASSPECVSQKSWLPNAWLLPEQGAPVLLIASRDALDRPPAGLVPFVPTVPTVPTVPEGEGEARR